ncbi:hypothetical protein [Bradyrhizobium liaoningense]|uniref:hypothetical protein n=1 Tax=Bradyrhizobium liaoningense TaxID=43992 RepID=UPI001BAA6FD5|nr:hypothetical protein [Bradyrhizobium liaoningense]MBR0988372.1 hypothetical protein [Bradyrhizobium liaoningense]
MTVSASAGQPLASVPQSPAEIGRVDDTVRKESVAPGNLNQEVTQSALLGQYGASAAPVQDGAPVHPGATIPAWRLGEGDAPGVLHDPPAGAAEIPAAWTARVPHADQRAGHVTTEELPLLGKTGVIDAHDASEFVREQIVGYGGIQIADRLADRRLDYQHVDDMFRGMTKLIPVLVKAEVKVLWTDALSSDQPLLSRIVAREGGPSEQDLNMLLKKVTSDHKNVPDLSTRLKSEVRFLRAAHQEGIEIRVLKKGEQPVRAPEDEGTFVVLGGNTNRDRPFLDVDVTGTQHLAPGQIRAFDDKTSVIDVGPRRPPQAPAPRTSPAPAAPKPWDDI